MGLAHWPGDGQVHVHVFGYRPWWTPQPWAHYFCLGPWGCTALRNQGSEGVSGAVQWPGVGRVPQADGHAPRFCPCDPGLPMAGPQPYGGSAPLLLRGE